MLTGCDDVPGADGLLPLSLFDRVTFLARDGVIVLGKAIGAQTRVFSQPFPPKIRRIRAVPRGFMVNLRFAFRMLFKAPFVTTVAIISLALGIGANAAIFSLFNQVLMRPLPVERPGELVNLGSPGPKPGSQSCGQPGDCDSVFSYPMFRDLEKQQTVLTGIAAHVFFGANLAYNSQTTSGDGRARLGQLLSGAQPAPRGRATAQPVG